MRLARSGDTGGERPAAGDTPVSVRRFASVIRLRPEKEAEYRALHADAWPGVLAKLREARIRNYSIYLRDGILFSYLEYVGDDYDADMATVAADPETQRWWQLTDPCQQPVDTVGEGQWWAPLEEVFHLD
jgi:L-rhamnose mutarotase